MKFIDQIIRQIEENPTYTPQEKVFHKEKVESQRENLLKGTLTPTQRKELKTAILNIVKNDKAKIRFAPKQNGLWVFDTKLGSLFVHNRDIIDHGLIECLKHA